jgi:hypothetical protein
VPSDSKADAPAPQALEATIRSFLESCQDPAILEPGEAPFAAAGDRLCLECGPRGVLLQVWDEHRNLVRRATKVVDQRPGRLRVEVALFGGKGGVLEIVDRGRPGARPALRKGEQQILRERFRRMLARQFAGWRVVELTSGADLEHSLSPNHPRALLRRGRAGWAALAAPPGGTDGALTHGLLWLDYLRGRESALAIEGLALFLPAGELASSCFRLRGLSAGRLRCSIFAYGEDGFESQVDASDWGNIDSRLHGPPSHDPPVALRPLLLEPGVEAVGLPGGTWSLRIRGLEFGRYERGELNHSMDPRVLHEIRSPDAEDRRHPLYMRNPEAWLESLLRADPSRIDPTLQPAPVYGQVTAVAGRDRGVLDLLAIDRGGRLAVLELKASEEAHLPLQALDYWLRIAHHAAQGDFESKGYFRGLPVRRDPPRLLLVAPALAFHPSTERILHFFDPRIEVERVGLGVEWQRSLRVVLRVRGAERPEWDAGDFA